MSVDEGYVKYRCVHEYGPAPQHPDWEALNALRTDLVRAGLVGVLDNGVGIEPEQLEQLRTALEQPAPRWEHIGIYNVAARLRLLDARCRVVVRSRPGRGTAVILYLPLVENEEEFEE